MSRILSIISLILMTVCSTAQAGLTANKVYRYCQTRDDAYELLCLGYLNGFMEGITLDHHFVIGKAITIHTVKRIFIRRLDDKPELGDENAAKVLFDVLREKKFLVKDWLN